MSFAVKSAALSIQRCGPGGCSCGSECSEHEASEAQESESPIQRLTAEEKEENLRSAKYGGNQRLEAVFDNAPLMRKGETGEPVRLIQEGLMQDGFPLPGSTKPTGELDGVFGSETEEAVRGFQMKHADEGLTDPSGFADGIIGRKTMGMLDRIAEAEGVPPDGDLPECEDTGDDEDVLTTFAQTPGTTAEPGAPAPLACKPRPKKPIKIVPIDPTRPIDLNNFQCESKRVLSVEIFTGATSQATSSGILHARLSLLPHNIDLNVSIKPISSPAFPLGFDLNIPGVGDGIVKAPIDMCELIAKTVKDVGHGGGLPVFVVPVGGQLKVSDEGVMAGFHLRPADQLCAGGDTTTGLTDVIIIDSRTDCVTTLLHEIGHAVGNRHEDAPNFMSPGSCKAEDNVIRHDQVRRFCNSQFS